MGYFSFPHTRTYDSDLGWLIKHLKGIDEKLDEYLENSVITFADPIQWDITEQYTALMMVIDSDGTAYLSKQPVPAGVDISNTDYWMPIFNYDDNINQLRSQIAYNAGDSATTTEDLTAGDLVFWHGLIYKTLSDIPAGSALIVGSNIEKYTVNDKFNDIQTEIDNIPDYSADIQNLNDRIDDEITNRVNAVSDEENARIAADNAINDRIDAIAAATQFFDTVADMKAADLDDGIICMTAGYYAVNDGGGSFYKISAALPDTYYETLDNNKFARLIHFEDMCVKQYGAYGDGVHDDTTALNNALAAAGAINFTEDTYLFNAVTTLAVQSGSVINGNGAILKINPNDATRYAGLALNESDHVVIRDLTIQGDKDDHTGTTGEWGHGISIMDSDDVFIENVNVYKCWGDGVYIGGYNDSSHRVYLNKIISDSNRRNGISVVRGVDITVENSSFTNTSGTAPQSGIAVESNSDQDIVGRVRFINCFAAYNAGTNAAYASLHHAGDIYFINCTLVNVSGTGLALTVLGAEAQACVFSVKNTDITASDPIVCVGINQNSTVDIDANVYRCIHAIRFAAYTVNYCRNVVANIRVIHANITDGAFLPLCLIAGCTLNIEFVDCTIADPRVLGNNNTEWTSCRIKLTSNLPKYVTPADGTYYPVGASNPTLILTGYSSTINALNWAAMPIGTEYTVINKSGYAQYFRNLPASRAIVGMTGESLPSNSVLKIYRADGTSLYGICYTLP